MGGGGPNFGSERTVELFYGKSLLSPPPHPHTPSHQLRLYVIIPWPLTVYLNCTRNASVNSSCVQCPPLGYCGAFTYLVSPGGGAFANFVLPGGRAFAYPGAIRKVLTRTRFPVNSYQNITTQRILLGGKADWLICQGQEKIEEGCKGMFLILCTHFFTDSQTRIT